VRRRISDHGRTPIRNLAAASERFARHPLAALLAFVALSLVAYWRVLDGWFLSDDCTLSFVVPDGESVAWDHVLRVFASDWVDRGAWAEVRYYRPIVILTQALDATIWGTQPVGYHLTNVVLHGTNGFLLHRLATGIGATGTAAGFAAVVFVLFPWHGESVAWISGRTDVLCTTFQLTTLLLYIAARSARTARRHGCLLSASLATFALALGSKEPAIALPALICCVDLILPARDRSPRQHLIRTAVAWVAFGTAVLAYLWVRQRALGTVWVAERRHSFLTARSGPPASPGTQATTWGCSFCHTIARPRTRPLRSSRGRTSLPSRPWESALWTPQGTD